MMRLMLELECGHRLVSDPEIDNPFPANDYCPACGLHVKVIGYDEYVDREVGS